MSEQKPWACKVALIDDQTICYTGIYDQTCTVPIRLDDLTRDLLTRFNFWIGEDKFVELEKEDLELLGRLLYTILFPEGEDPNKNPRNLFENDYRSFSKLKNPHDRLRLTLEVHQKAGELSKLPWEFLFMPAAKGGFFLAGQNSELVLTRFVPNVPSDLKIKTEEPLRILVIFSHPRELPSIDSQLTRALIEEIIALESLKHIEVRFEENPTHKKLRELMDSDEVRGDAGKKSQERLRFQPDIIHFIGHGEPGKLALMREKEDIEKEEDKTGHHTETLWCNSKAVLELFVKHTPRLVFLHACDSSKTVAGFSDLARDLVYAKVPVVVAMQYTIRNKDAALFAKKFYEEIRKGRRIDEAVQAGRGTLGQRQDKTGAWSDRRFGTPVVYLQAESNEALIKCEPELELAGADEPGLDLNVKVPCPNPRCDGRLTLDSIECIVCDEPVMLCPGCPAKGKSSLISKKTQRCGRCGYRQATIRTVAAASAGEAVQSQKDAAQPEDEASRPTPLFPAGASTAVQSQKDAAQPEDEASRLTPLFPAGASTAVQSQKDAAQPEDEASRPTPLVPAGASTAPALASLANLEPDETKGD